MNVIDFKIEGNEILSITLQMSISELGSLIGVKTNAIDHKEVNGKLKRVFELIGGKY